MTLPAAIWAFAGGAFYIVWIIMVVNFVYNLYPIMMQRYNRARLCRILRRMGIQGEYGWHREFPAAG